jgi:hypothetical protein
MQPFNSKTVLAILFGIGAYGISYFLGTSLSGWSGILIRSIIFSSLFSFAIYYWKITPDTDQLILQIQHRLRKK